MEAVKRKSVELLNALTKEDLKHCFEKTNRMVVKSEGKYSIVE